VTENQKINFESKASSPTQIMGNLNHVDIRVTG